jgi:tRNA-guanine family transglycosylase
MLMAREQTGTNPMLQPWMPQDIRVGQQVMQTPVVWFGQSVDTSVLLARNATMRAWPALTSLGDALRRSRYLRTHFNEGLRAKLGLRGPLMLDSGGFMLMRVQAKEWSAARIAEVYRQVDADVMVSLDHPILSSDSAARRRRKLRLTIDNLRRLSDQFGPDKLMPVVHGHTIAQIEDNCAAIHAISPRPHWIGVGGLVPFLKTLGRKGLAASERRRNEHFSAVIWTVRKAFPHSLVHMLGVGAPRSCLAAFAMGAHSVDSQGWRHAAGFGSIYLPGKAQRILQWDRPTKRPRPIIDEDDRAMLAACSCPACRNCDKLDDRILLLKSSFEPRSIHNAWVLHQEVAALRSAWRSNRIPAFLLSRLPPSWADVILPQLVSSTSDKICGSATPNLCPSAASAAAARL